MRGIIRTLALGAVLAAGTTAAMAQGVNNTGYDRSYYGDPGYYGNDGRYIRNPGYSSFGYVPGPVMQPYGYYGNNYGYGSSYQPGWGYGYGSSEQRGWGSGGGAAYDRGYDRPYNYGYWGR